MKLNELPDAELVIRDPSGDVAYKIKPDKIKAEKRANGETLLVLDLGKADFELSVNPDTDELEWEEI